MSQKYTLPINRQAGLIGTDLYKLLLSDVNTVASTVATVTLDTLAANTLVSNPQWFLKTSFSGGSATALVMSLGTSSSATLFLPSTSVFSSAAVLPIIAQATYKPNAIQALDSLVATFTATGANMSTFTAGEVDIYVAKPRLDTEANY